MNAQRVRTGRLDRSFLPQISAVVGQEQFKTGSDQVEAKEYYRDFFLAKAEIESLAGSLTPKSSLPH